MHETSPVFLDHFDGHVRPVLQHCAEDLAHAPLANALPPFDLAPRDLVSGDARRVVTVRRRNPMHCGRLDLGVGKRVTWCTQSSHPGDLMQGTGCKCMVLMIERADELRIELMQAHIFRAQA